MTTNLDSYLARHLRAWCEREALEPDETERSVLAYLAGLDEQEHADAIERGWRWVADEAEKGGAS